MKFVSRSEWGARSPTAGYTHINSQVTTGHWEGPHMGTFGHESCAPKVRGIQAYHMDGNGWSDIAYNGVACPHGYVFEGRGPQVRSAANGTNEGNDTSAVICYLGGEGDEFTAEGQQAMSDGAAWLGDPMQKGHRDWFNTACPGDVIYNWIQTGASTPQPQPEPEEDILPLHLIVGDRKPEWFVTDMVTKRYVQSPGEAARIVVRTVSQGGRIEQNGNNGPVTYEQVDVDAIPTVE